jgi:hypothetical protein
MAPSNMLDPYYVEIFPHMHPNQQRIGVDTIRAKCAEIEGAGSTDAQLVLMGQQNALSLPEERMAIVASGLSDQCYWELTKYLRMSD